MKKKLNDTQRTGLRKFLETSKEAVIEAELNTYRETNVSDHTPRLYIFTTFTMGIAELRPRGAGDMYNSIADAIRQFKQQELGALDGEAKELHISHGSFVVGLLSFFPGRMLNVNDEYLKTLDPEVQTKVKNGKMSPSKFASIYGKDKIEDVINIQFNSFYENEMQLYKVIEHNDEVLDMTFITTENLDKGTNGGSMIKVKELIEVE
jgi:hypothetical protein